MTEHTIRELVKLAEYEVGSRGSMSPEPYTFSRHRIEDGNGNEIFASEAAEYINSMQVLVPSLCKSIEFLLAELREHQEIAHRYKELSK